MLILGLVLSFIFVTAPTYAPPSQANTPSAQLSGRIVEEGTGAPISSARVILFPQPRNAPGLVPQTITDQNGRYAFEGVAPGRYRVDVQKSGLLPLADSAKAPTVTLAAGQVIDDWNVSVQKGGAIAGRILDPFGEPLVDVAVRAVRRTESGAVPSPAVANGPLSSDPRAQGIPTNDLGEFRVFGLAPGEYLVTATPQQRFEAQSISTDMALRVSTFYPGVSDVSAAQPITVTSGETVGGVEFRLLTTPGFSVTGIIVDQAGAPVAGVMVMLRGDSRFDPRGVVVMGPAGQSSSDANGRFVFGNISSGLYYVIVIPPTGNVDLRNAIIRNGYIVTSGGPQAPGTDPIAVTVNDANIEDLRIVLQFGQQQ